MTDGKVDLASVSKQYKAGSVLPARITDLSGVFLDPCHNLISSAPAHATAAQSMHGPASWRSRSYPKP